MKTEFGLIEQLRRRSATSKIGDDCAVVPKDAKTDLVLTTDLLIEDIDFRREWMIPEFLGHKALTVSLSDVAAMGAQPVWAMLSIGIPENIWKTDFVEKFYEGWFALAKKFNIELIGGDISKTPDKIVIDSIVAGEVKKGEAILRSGAKVGDLIFVTGEVGAAAAGLKLLESGERFDKQNYKTALLRQLQPNPQTEIGRLIGRKKLATAMIDLSDGLSSDLWHLCRESSIGAKIYADKIPFYEKSNSLTESFNEKMRFALDGGEDFELLFTVNPKKKKRLENELKNYRISHIGETTANVEMMEVIAGEDSSFFEPRGFRHF